MENFTKNKNCFICSKPIKILIKLKNFPNIETFVSRRRKNKQNKNDQSFCFCDKCVHGQLFLTIKKEKQNKYKFRSSKSIIVDENTENFLNFFNKIKKKKSSLMEIGCNDGHLLRKLKNNFRYIYGIDPIFNKNKVLEKKIRLIGLDIEKDLVDKKIKKKFDVIICRHTIEHFEKPKITLDKILKMSSKNAIIFFEFPELSSMITKERFNYIFNEHLSYFSLKSFLILLKKYKAKIIDINYDYTSWGTIMIAFKINQSKSNLNSFKLTHISKKQILDNYKNFLIQNKIIINKLKKIKYNFLCYGASELITIQNYHLKNKLKKAKFIIDDSKFKINKMLLSLNSRITSPNKIRHIIKNKSILITATHAIHKILPKLVKFNPKKIINNHFII